MEGIARYKEIPNEAPHNIQRGDSKRETDRVVQAWSKTTLHTLRCLPDLYRMVPTGDGSILLQKVWQLQAELFKRLTEYRKEASMPGSAGNEAGHALLFSKEEVAN